MVAAISGDSSDKNLRISSYSGGVKALVGVGVGDAVGDDTTVGDVVAIGAGVSDVVGDDTTVGDVVAVSAGVDVAVICHTYHEVPSSALAAHGPPKADSNSSGPALKTMNP